MTKSELQELEHVGYILESLIRKDSEDPTKPESYRKALIEAQDHFSMLLTVTDAHKEAVLDHNFWNDELAAFVNDNKLDKTFHYEAEMWRETNGDWTLKICRMPDGDADELDQNFENYISDDDVSEDVSFLLKLGYDIAFTI